MLTINRVPDNQGFRVIEAWRRNWTSKMPAHIARSPYGGQVVPVDSFHWVPQPCSTGRRAFLSVWNFLHQCANEPSGCVAQCRTHVVDPKPYDRWGIQDERRAMLQADFRIEALQSSGKASESSDSSTECAEPCNVKCRIGFQGMVKRRRV